MAAYKKLNSDYTLDTPDVFLTGNLHVAGIYETTTVVDLQVEDRNIVMNVGETGWGVGGNAAPGTSGLFVDRGLQANVGIRWKESIRNWEITADGTNYSNISTSGATAIVNDTNPHLGGNLVTNGFNIQFQTGTKIPPTLVTGNTVLYSSGIVGSAGSGLYVVNSKTASDELVTKSKAIAFSLIL